ncbi:unnamed protein product, partial [Mesorhabditis belari]|uniref:Innexin n=1 Tax=Mesorhabditis belari TaxID=2138241 RepID=A0AAF3EDG4_9BILA
MNIIQGILSSVKPLPDSDFSDRLSYVYSTLGLIIGSAFVSGWSFVGSPIQCWFPAYYKGWWMEYALDYCYVQNTYFLPFTDIKPSNDWDFANHIVPYPKNLTDREDKQLGYYQWVPFILALQAFLFYLPILIWRTVYEGSGFKVATICQTCSIAGNMEEADRAKNMRIISGFLVYEHSVSNAIGGRVRRATSGSYIVGTYIITKVLFFCNALLQFVLLKGFLGVDSFLWGWQVFTDLLGGIEWPESGNFPRVTFCDFEVRVLGNLHRHSVQCVLMINMFNEKIFVFLWFWVFVVLAFSFYSMIFWLATGFSTNVGKNAVKKYIQKIDPSVKENTYKKSLLQSFVVEKLRADGVFLIRLISSNSGEMVTYSLLKTLWEEYVKEKGAQPPPYSKPLLLAKKDVEESDF